MLTLITVEEVSLDSLREHPRQREFFVSATKVELEELAADLQGRGQQEPIHVCPDGTIIRGHRRVAAAKSLGWKSIKAIIRHDLPDAYSDSTIAELITDNLVRQQLDDLALARCYHELKQSYARAGDDREMGDLRDRLAARLRTGRSGRSLDRLERLLQLPRDIQDMITTNLLNKHQGEKILRLAKPKQDDLFAELQRGEPVPDVLRRYGVIAPVTRKSPAQLGEDLLTFFRMNLPTVSREIQALDRLQVRGGDVVKLLDEATTFLAAWSNRKRLLGQQAIESMKSSVSMRQQPDKLSNGSR